MDSKEFLTPGSMLTPGMAGGTTMAMTNVLAGQFDIGALATAFLGLGLSFLFGLLVFVADEISWLKRCVYYVLNSLVIFVVAMGSNSVGENVQLRRAGLATLQTADVAHAGPSILDLLVGAAHAQPNAASTAHARGWCCTSAGIKPAEHADCKIGKTELWTTEGAARQACTPPPRQQPRERRQGFFKAWGVERKG